MSESRAEPVDRDAEKRQLAELAEFMTKGGIDYQLLFVADPAALPEERLVEAMVQARRTHESLCAEFARRHKARAKAAEPGGPARGP